MHRVGLDSSVLRAGRSSMAPERWTCFPWCAQVKLDSPRRTMVTLDRNGELLVVVVEEVSPYDYRLPLDSVVSAVIIEAEGDFGPVDLTTDETRRALSMELFE